MTLQQAYLVQWPMLIGEHKMPEDADLIVGLYKSFNARDIEGALATMHPDVAWDNDLEGGYVHGHAGVREYWTRQWAIMNSQAEPLKYHVGDDGRLLMSRPV